ncbi:MAG: flagellar motor switch protein FliM [Myxococcales bacterium]|nr:flagellar motor switch protein FliM [Myxococcales bacterium]
MTDQILSQNEIDALLSAVNDGEINLEDDEAEGAEVDEAAQAAVKYDLLSQDRIIRGRMPTLDIINDRFARQFRITLSNSLRKILQVAVESTSLMKYGEFLNYLPIPSCLNIVRLHPLRGSVIVAIETKLIFTFLNNWFGGSTNAQERIEGRDFTAIELMIVRKVVRLLMDDLERSWHPVFPVRGEYLRTEINPQFLAVVAPSDVVVLTSFEIEIDNLRGTVQVVIPYSTVEPIRQHLSSGMQSEGGAEENTWTDQIGEHLLEVEAGASVVLGRSLITIRDLIDLKVGDVITLDQQQVDPLQMFVERALKYTVTPLERAGYLAAEVVGEIEPRRPPDNQQVAAQLEHDDDE